jgi:uncharacterized protein YndB with AHSA1/START domain
MILKAAGAVFILLLVVLLLAATKPDKFHVERSIAIKAPPATVFSLIDDFHQWGRWAPQDREDPTMQRTFSGSSSGVGAVSQWAGRGSAGSGEMTILKSQPGSQVEVAVNWLKPFRVQNINTFVLVEAGGQTRLTWTAEGTNLYVMKLMEVFIGVDGLMGRHFETGLRNLKAAAEH